MSVWVKSVKNPWTAKGLKFSVSQAMASLLAMAVEQIEQVVGRKTADEAINLQVCNSMVVVYNFDKPRLKLYKRQ